MQKFIKSFLPKKLFLIPYSLFLIPYSLFAADPNPIPRVNMFSTTTDWEAVTGLRLSQHQIEFTTDRRIVGRDGMQIYILDGFPCYGQPDKTEMWIGQNGDTRNGIRIVCLYRPDILRFAWRDAARDATQNTTTGILECPLRDDWTIRLTDCTKGPDWGELK